MIKQKKYNIFVCNSIFHLIISLGIIYNLGLEKKSKLIVFEDRIWKKFSKLIKENSNIETEIIDNWSLLKRYINPLKYNYKEKYKSISLNIFTNYTFSQQMFIKKFYNKFKKLDYNINLIEEGIWSYFIKNEKRKLIKFINFFLSFFWLKITLTWWDNKYIQKCYLRFRNLRKFKNKNIYEIDIIDIINKSITKIKKVLEIKDIATNKDLIFAWNSYLFDNKNKYIKYIEKLLEKENYENIFIKPHPKEDENIYKNLKIKNYKIIDKFLPLEIIWQNTNIISFYTSGVLNLNSNIKIIKTDLEINDPHYKVFIDIIKKYYKNIELINW